MYQHSKYLVILSRIVFFLYFFFTTFGTSLPFQERNWDVSEIATSNILNQIIYTILFLASIFLILNQRKRVVEIIRFEKFLSLFVLWCTISVLWSDYPIVSIKRLIQFYTAISVCISFFLYNSDLKIALNHFFTVLGTFLILSLISVFTIPGAIDQAAQGWRGLAPQKNHLGQVVVYSSIIWIYSIFHSVSIKKWASVFLLILTAILLIGARSTTAYLTIFYILSIRFSFLLDKIFKPLGLRKSFSILIIGTIIILNTIVILFYPEVLEQFAGSLGKDLTFTGRTQLWVDVLKGGNLIFGYGYQGYWVLDSPRILLLYTVYNWLPNMGHSGYVDILNETGLIGLLMVIGIIANYFYTIFRYKVKSIGTWLLIGAIITNLTETIMFRGAILGGVLFIFSYFLLFFNIKNLESNNSKAL